jgi:hypothetical protein
MGPPSFGEDDKDSRDWPDSEDQGSVGLPGQCRPGTNYETVAALLGILALATVVVWECARRSDFERRFEEIRPNMSVDEVAEILGPPHLETDFVYAWGFNDRLRRISIEIFLDKDRRVVKKRLKIYRREFF